MKIRFELSLILALALFSAGCQRIDVMSDLSEGDAIELIVLLRQNGVEAEKKRVASSQDGRWSLTVRSADASQAFLILSENDRPRDEPRGFAELLGGSHLLPTEIEENAMFLQARAGELARTIESMPGVIHARVHLSAPEPDPLRQALQEEAPAPRAAVFVKQWAPARVDAESARTTEEDIKTLVAGSIERLDASNVAVVMKTVSPMTVPEIERRIDSSVLFYPLAALTLLLVVLLAALAARNRSLARRISEPSMHAASRSS
jgi:type III secretion protein J